MKEDSFVGVVSDSLMEWKETQKDTTTTSEQSKNMFMVLN